MGLRGRRSAFKEAPCSGAVKRLGRKLCRWPERVRLTTRGTANPARAQGQPRKPRDITLPPRQPRWRARPQSSALSHIHGVPRMNKEGLTKRNQTQTLPSSSLQTAETYKMLGKKTRSLRAAEPLKEGGLSRRSHASQPLPLRARSRGQGPRAQLTIGEEGRTPA